MTLSLISISLPIHKNFILKLLTQDHEEHRLKHRQIIKYKYQFILKTATQIISIMCWGTNVSKTRDITIRQENPNQISHIEKY